MSLIYIKNTIEILNNILESDTFPLMSGYYTVIKKHDLRSVISLLSDLQTENEKLQKMYQEEKVVCHEIQLELERMKQERDAAVKDIPHECKTCAYHMVSFNGCTPDHDCTNPDGGCSNNYDRWIWRGQKED